MLNRCWVIVRIKHLVVYTSPLAIYIYRHVPVEYGNIGALFYYASMYKRTWRDPLMIYWIPLKSWVDVGMKVLEKLLWISSSLFTLVYFQCFNNLSLLWLLFCQYFLFTNTLYHFWIGPCGTFISSTYRCFGWEMAATFRSLRCGLSTPSSGHNKKCNSPKYNFLTCFMKATMGI